MTRNHRRILFLAAESAASLSLNHANFFFRQAKQLNEGFVNVVRTLHRTPNSHAIVRTRQGDSAIVLDVKLFLRAGFVFTFDDGLCLQPGFVDVSLINQKFFEDIIFTPNNLLLCERIVQRKDSGQLFVFDAHVPSRFFNEIFVFVSEQKDRLFMMIHAVLGEIRLVVKNQRDIVLAGNIFGRNDCEFVPWNISLERNLLYAATCYRTAYGHAMQHARKAQIINIECLARDFLAAFFAGNWLANKTHEKLKDGPYPTKDFAMRVVTES